MTKKDFELIASILKNSEHYIGQYAKSSIYKNIVYNFATTLYNKNIKFQKGKFIQLCGVEIEEANETPEEHECEACGSDALGYMDRYCEECEEDMKK